MWYTNTLDSYSSDMQHNSVDASRTPGVEAPMGFPFVPLRPLSTSTDNQLPAVYKHTTNVNKIDSSYPWPSITHNTAHQISAPQSGLEFTHLPDGSFFHTGTDSNTTSVAGVRQPFMPSSLTHVNFGITHEHGGGGGGVGGMQGWNAMQRLQPNGNDHHLRSQHQVNGMQQATSHHMLSATSTHRPPHTPAYPSPYNYRTPDYPRQSTGNFTNRSPSAFETTTRTTTGSLTPADSHNPTFHSHSNAIQPAELDEASKPRGRKRKTRAAANAAVTDENILPVPHPQSDIDSESDDGDIQHVFTFTSMADAKKHEIARIALTKEALKHDDWKEIKRSKRAQKEWVLKIMAALRSEPKPAPDGELHQSIEHQMEWKRWQDLHRKKATEKLNEAEMRAWHLLWQVLDAHRKGIIKTGFGTDRSSIASVRLGSVVQAITGFPIVALDVLKAHDFPELVANPTGFNSRKVNNLWINFGKKQGKAEKDRLQALHKAQQSGGDVTGADEHARAASAFGGIAEEDGMAGGGAVDVQNVEKGRTDSEQPEADEDETNEAITMVGREETGVGEETDALEDSAGEVVFEDDPATSLWRPGKRQKVAC